MDKAVFTLLVEPTLTGTTNHGSRNVAEGFSIPALAMVVTAPFFAHLFGMRQ
jgi:hypothetical protein